MRPAWFLFICALSFVLVQSCNSIGQEGDDNSDFSESLIERDLDEIVESGVLRVVTMYSSTNYFLYRGEPMGYEYELVQRLAEYLKLELQVIIARDLGELFEKLNNGEGDIIAAGITITNERKHNIRFTDYLYLTKQVLVQKKPDNWRSLMRHQIDENLVKDPIDLIGDTVHVPKGSSYFNRLQHLQEEIGGNIHIKVIDGELPVEKIISMIVDGDIKYTVADQSLAEVSASYYPVLDVQTPISFSQRIAWAVRKNSSNLVDTVNFWIKKMKKYNDYYAIYDKYFRSSRSYKKRVKSDFYSENTGKISPYDDLIKLYTQPTGWDWRLISSLVYQESHFDPEAESWVSANGLMQLMPSTAEEMGITDMSDPNQNIRGGIKYLRSIWKQWETIPDSIQRLKFTFASYNCGIHHVQDAQRLCENEGKNPDIWDGNVEEEVLNLTYSKYYSDPAVKYGYVRGREPVSYVKEIFERYEVYKQFIES